MKKHKTFVIGLTGSIAMGKSTASKMFESCGALVFCADLAVHDIIKNNKSAQNKIIKLFPSCVWAGKISRKRLGAFVFKDEDKTKQLESVIHPLVETEMKRYIKKNKGHIILCDVPLLFEKGWENHCDVSVCVVAKKETQIERVLKRKNMDIKKLRAIIKQQMPSAEKKKRATYVISSDYGKTYMHQQIKAIWKEINA